MTTDVEGSIDQIMRCADAGAQLVRLTVQGQVCVLQCARVCCARVCVHVRCVHVRACLRACVNPCALHLPRDPTLNSTEPFARDPGSRALKHMPLILTNPAPATLSCEALKQTHGSARRTRRRKSKKGCSRRATARRWWLIFTSRLKLRCRCRQLGSLARSVYLALALALSRSLARTLSLSFSL